MGVEINDELKYYPVADFYAGKSVFITGGTGFLGKVLIEKLLYSCPNIDKIYVLAREKKGIKPDQRLAPIIDNPLFMRLKEKRPDDLKKLALISGDMLQANLGISPECEAVLTEKVSVVFHAAASVRFNDPLKYALQLNFEGTEKVLNLCKRMKKIEILIHISTAYTQCNKVTIDEIVYSAPADINAVYSHIKQNENTLETARLLNGLPNTYTFTKALAENMIMDHHGSIPAVIIRPSIVTSILKGPAEGWLDNWYGATGVCMDIAKGINRSLYGSEDNIIDLIPVDYVTNCSIVAAARNSRINGVSVYNCSSSSSNPITLGELIGTFVKDAVKHRAYIVPFSEVYIITKYKILVTLITLFQIISAYIADFLRRLCGKSPRYVKIQSRINLARETQEFFYSHSWIIKNDQVRRLHVSLSNNDKLLFPMDPNDINWKTYLPKYYAGVRKYLEKINK